MSATDYCPNCGLEPAPGHDYCTGCGSKLESVGPQECPECSSPVESTEFAFCTKCGAPLTEAPAPPDPAPAPLVESQPSPPRVYNTPDPDPPPRKSHVGAAVGIVVLLLVVPILFVPLPTPYSRTINSVSALTVLFGGSFDSNYVGLMNVVSNSSVTGTWSAATGQPVLFMVISQEGVTLFQATAGSGSFTFTAPSTGVNTTFAFVAVTILPDSVAVSGSVQQSLLFGIFEGN